MLINRLKFEDENDVKCFQDDPQLPIYAALPFGYPVHELIDILMKSDMPLQKICTVQPLGVTENAVFVISIDDVIFDDLKADDLGSWKGTGTKEFFFDSCHLVVSDFRRENLIQELHQSITS